jgi:hypothetical protein
MTLPKALGTLVLLLVLSPFAWAQDTKSDPGGPSSPVATPRAVLDQTMHDFGEVRSGRPLRWAFKVKNVGNADLVIHSIEAG